MIIDFRVRLPFREQFPGADPSDLSFVPSYMTHYMELFASNLKRNPGVEDLIQAMDAQDIDHCVIQAEWEFGDYHVLNQSVKRLIDRHPDRFSGFCTVHPEESLDMAKEVAEWVAAGMRGVNLQPWAYKVHAHHPKFYPLYEKCAELGVPVAIHTGINYSLNRGMDFGRPIYLDQIACDFPELKIVASHGGWPWVNEMVAVAWKHRNVFIETGAVSPKYIARPGTGWETLIQYGNSVLSHQILYASEWPLLPFEKVVAEAEALPLREDVRRKYLHDNAKALLGLGT